MVQVCFCILLVDISGESGHTNGRRSVKIELVVFFGFAIIFIISLVIGLMQLQHEIKRKWMKDKYCRQTIRSWLVSYIRVLYFLSVITGSSFSAIELCNSNLFRCWQMF